MTLRGKFFVRNGLSLASVLALATVGIYGLSSLQLDVQIALREYRELEQVENLGLRLTTAKTYLVSRDDTAALEQCRVVARLLKSFAQDQESLSSSPGYSAEHDAREAEFAERGA